MYTGIFFRNFYIKSLYINPIYFFFLIKYHIKYL